MREQLKYLPEDQLEVLFLSDQEFRDARVDDHEVKVKGKMYDIARIESSGDRLKIYCIHDELEDNFLHLFAELVSKPIEDTSSFPTTVIDFINLNFLLHGNGIEFNNSFVHIHPGFAYQHSAGISVNDIQTPPPKG